MDTVLADPGVAWDALFEGLRPRGRHRRGLRWRRDFVVDLVRRAFPRGGVRQRNPPAAGTPVRRRGPPPLRPLKTAPWYVAVNEREAFEPEEVWERFRTTFPVLAIYRAGWVAAGAIAESLADAEPLVAAFADGFAGLPECGAALAWPSPLRNAADVVCTMAERLWPDEPWPEWRAADGRVARAAVPLLRRAACLLYGFHLGGCSMRGVMEAVRMPERGATAAAAHK